jgi:flagellar biosynthesis protein FlhB
MSEDKDSGQDKTEEPTEKRLREAREEGQLPRSKELSTAAVFGTGVISMYALGGWMAAAAADVFRGAMTIDPGRVGDVRMLPGHFGRLALDMLLVISPMAIACVLIGIFAPSLLGGFNFSTKALAPKFSKLNPIAGMKRIYGREGLAELARSILRVVVIASLFVVMIQQIVPQLIALMHQPLGRAAGEGFGMALLTLIAMAAGLSLIAAGDIPYQMWSHRKKLMMTRQQLRDEMKESEGRPEVKQKIRQLQHEMAQRQMMEAIPTADVVLVNPTHYAVAIAYDAGRMRAPKVVAKGVDELAATIRRLAEHHEVPIVSSPPLARTLYAQVQIGREVPVNLYAAIAQVLTYVYQLRNWRRAGGEYPALPEIAVGGAPKDG